MKWIAFWFCILAGVWFGFVQGVDGPRYLVTFSVFVLAAMMPFTCTDAVVRQVAAQPERPASQQIASYIMLWVVLLALVWSGAMFTGAAWLWVMVCGAVNRELVRRHRARVAGGES